jgi:ElaB/YqjD/DUF883 family membrane-anchored ribosome-binding protein
MTQPSDPLLSGGVDPLSGRYPTGIPEPSAQRGQRPSTTDVAKDQAGEVANTASDAAKHVAGVAGEQAGQVASEATQQVKQLVQQTRSELNEQAATQQKRVASGLRSLSKELRAMAHGSEQPGMATDLVQQAAERTNAVASWLEEREPGHVVDEVTRFARQRPGTFLAVAAGAGFLVGRLGRGLKAASNDSGGNASPEGPGNTPKPRMGDTSGRANAAAPPPPVPTYPPAPGYDPGGYQPAPGYQQPPAPAYPPPAPSYPQPAPGYPPGPSGRDLAP